MSNGKNQNGKHHSAPPTSTKDRFRSPFKTAATPENGTNGNQSDEYETPKKVFENYFLFIEIFYLIFRKKLLRNVQEQLDHFEMHLEKYVSSVQFQHVKVVYHDKVNYIVNGNFCLLQTIFILSKI